MKYLLSILSATFLLSTSAMADEPVKHPCNIPVVPIPQASDVVVKYFNKHVLEYKTCIAKFVEEQSAISKSNPDPVIANAAHDAAEATIKEYNAFMALLDERNTQAGSDEEKD